MTRRNKLALIWAALLSFALCGLATVLGPKALRYYASTGASLPLWKVAAFRLVHLMDRYSPAFFIGFYLVGYWWFRREDHREPRP